MADRAPRRPVLRLFGVAGDASPELRWYAARHGIALVERSRWPAAVLADTVCRGPPVTARARSTASAWTWLSRPLQLVYPRLPDGRLVLPAASRTRRSNRSSRFTTNGPTSCGTSSTPVWFA